MNEDEWWERYKAFLQKQPYTGNNPLALFDLLMTSGYYRPRTGLSRPSAMTPERQALAAWRLRFKAPKSALENAERVWGALL